MTAPIVPSASLFQFVNARNNGAFISLVTERPCKVRKKAGREVTKRSEFTMRQGHSYYNQKAVIEKHESGEREIYTAEKLWHKKSEIGTAFREHKGNGQIYLVGQPSVGNNHKAKTQFFLDGEAASFEEVEPFLLASEKNKSQSDHIMIKVENVVSFN